MTVGCLKAKRDPSLRFVAGMTILIGWSLQFNLEGAIRGFVAMGHVAASAVGLSRFHCGGGIVELALRDKHIDLGQAVGTVEREPPAIVNVPSLPVSHDHGQVLLELSDVGVGRGAVFGG